MKDVKGVFKNLEKKLTQSGWFHDLGDNFVVCQMRVVVAVAAPHRAL